MSGFGWRRVVLLRRIAAGLLVVTALLLAVRSPSASDTATVLVAVHDLAPGSTLHGTDVAQRRWPRDLVPSGALRTVADVDGKVLAGAASSGEPLTVLRLAGPELARQASGRPDSASVPIRLTDPDVAGLLGPGQLVDVVTVGEHSNQPTILASAAKVLTVLPNSGKAAAGRGRIVLVVVPRSVAAKLAAATLSQDVTVTLR
jgi:pilus assembly protein CpaB